MKPVKDFEDCVTQMEVNPLTAIDVFLRCLIMCIEVPMKIIWECKERCSLIIGYKGLN